MAFRIALLSLVVRVQKHLVNFFWWLHTTVNSLLTDTCIRWTPLQDSHLVLVLAAFQSFYCN